MTHHFGVLRSKSMIADSWAAECVASHLRCVQIAVPSDVIGRKSRDGAAKRVATSEHFNCVAIWCALYRLRHAFKHGIVHTATLPAREKAFVHAWLPSSRVLQHGLHRVPLLEELQRTTPARRAATQEVVVCL